MLDEMSTHINKEMDWGTECLKMMLASVLASV